MSSASLEPLDDDDDDLFTTTALPSPFSPLLTLLAMLICWALPAVLSYIAMQKKARDNERRAQDTKKLELKALKVDYNRARDRKDVQTLLNAYASDPMGDGEPLPPELLDNLPSALIAVPGAFSVVAYDAVSNEALGLCNCFEGFSTFKCKPLINIHDCYVVPKARGLGVVDCMLSEIERVAFARGACKITLEVLSENFRAQRAYTRFGFVARMMDGPIEVDDTWTTTASGLRYKDVVVGSGEKPQEGDVVKVDYTGWLEDGGKMFDSSKGRSPIAFPVGKGRVIPGWDEGVASMSVGTKRIMSIPANLAYGDNGAGADIPPGADLQFECELKSIESGVSGIIASFPGGLPNVILVSLLLLSFIPYYLPPDQVPDFWKA